MRHERLPPHNGLRGRLVSHPHPDLSLPTQLPRNGLRLVGLGGLGEIGRNMTVFEYRGRLLVVDCGVLFPEPDQPGVDLVLPDFSSLDDRFGLIEAIVITHAHEDHIGGIPYLLRERPDIPLVGRSMVRNMGVARDLGYLRIPVVPGGLMVDLKEAEDLPPDRIVLISTGSQGEPMSALSRMAGRDHPIRVAEGDTVILASSLIPGNETAVYRVINALTRWGARVVHRGNAMVHVSGHASEGELLYVLNLARPRNFMPVHGEWRHLRAHARLASLTGVSDDNIVIAENGMVVDLVDGKASVTGAVPCGYVYVDGLSVGEVTETSLKDRRILGDEGFVSIVVVVDSTTGKLAAAPEIHARGSGIDDAALAAVIPRIEDALASAAAEGINDSRQLGQLVRRTVGRWVNENYRRRPMIIPVVVDV